MRPDVDAIALAAAAALLVMGAAAAAVQKWRLALAAVIVGLSMAVLANSDSLDARGVLVTAVLPIIPLLAPLAAWACSPTTPLIRVALAGGVVAGPLRAILYDPFLDPTCLSVCTRNPLAIAHVSGAANTALWAGAVVAGAALTGAGARGPRRIALGMLATSAWLVALRPASAAQASILTAGVLLAAGGRTVAREFEARARVADLTTALRAAADVEVTLRAQVGDPGITVSYLLGDGDEFVDRFGRPSSSLAPGQVPTDVVGPEGVVARVAHDPDLSDPATLAAVIRGPARLAIDNGRLAATVSQQADALSASRRRIVAHADSERRRLERDLHDGAQQHVLALGLALRTALDGASDPGTQIVLNRCLESTHLALAELRDLSHGFYPASLAQTGLGNALDGVADRAPVPVSVTSVPGDRMPAEIERAIYLLVSRLAATARDPLEVSIARSQDVVEVVAEGAGLPDGVLADVFAVLGGTLEDHGADGGGVVPVVRATLPLHDRVHKEVL
jgi:signal transduction histidine kinase